MNKNNIAKVVREATTRGSHSSADTHQPSQEPMIYFVTTRTKKLAEIKASDVPRGLDPEDFVTDYHP